MSGLLPIHQMTGIQGTIERLQNALKQNDTNNICTLLNSAEDRLSNSLDTIHKHICHLPGKILNKKWDKKRINNCLNQIDLHINFAHKKHQTYCKFIMHIILLFKFYEHYFLSHDTYDFSISAEHYQIQQLIKTDLLQLQLQ